MGKLVDGCHGRAGGPGDGHGVADMVAVAVRHQDEGHRADVRHRGLERRITEPGIDEDAGAGALEFHGGMPVKGYLDAFAHYCCSHGTLLCDKQQMKKKYYFPVRHSLFSFLFALLSSLLSLQQVHQLIQIYFGAQGD